MAFHDLRSFIARLERDRQRVQAPVDPEFESTLLCLRPLREARHF